jgi:hypothetical protein
MRISGISPLLVVWLALVFVVGLILSFTSHENSLIPGEFLLVTGVALIFIGGVLGCARTGKWLTGDGQVIPSTIEWFLGLTGAILFVAPLFRILLLFIWQVFSGAAL